MLRWKPFVQLADNPYACGVDAIEVDPQSSAIKQRAILANEIRLAGIKCGAICEDSIPNGPELIATVQGMADRIIELTPLAAKYVASVANAARGS